MMRLNTVHGKLEYMINIIQRKGSVDMNEKGR